MDILQTEKSGKIAINIHGLNLTGLFVELAKENSSDFNTIKDIASAFEVNVVPFSRKPNFIQKESEIGFIGRSLREDTIVLYSNYFICFGIVNMLGYYSTISPIKWNSFECSYFEVKFTSDDKKILKEVVKESIRSNNEVLKIQEKQANEVLKIQDKNRLLQEKQANELQKNEMLSKINNCLITTTPNLEGYTISVYHGTVSAFSILRLDIFQEIFADFGDMFGGKSKGFENKFKDLQNDVENKLKYMSITKGGNAIIGASFDVEFIETSTGEKRLLSNADKIERKLLIGASGTSVSIIKSN